MKKIPYFVVGFLLIGSLATIGHYAAEETKLHDSISMSFTELIVKDSNINDFVEITYKGADSVISRAGEPMLPVQKTKLTYPFGVEIVSVNCEIGEVQTMTLENKVQPAPQPVLQGINVQNQQEYLPSETIYEINELYPNNWFNYKVGVGLDENLEHKTFLILETNPVRYNPVTNTISYIEAIKLTVEYNNAETNPFQGRADYDMVIIAPESFESALNPLITHKQGIGVSTLFESTESIYTGGYPGVDKPEQIKYFIKYALEEYNIKYVLLVGGLNSYWYGKPRDDRNQGTADWYVPVRYTNLRDSGGTYDPGYLSDLYYADIYENGGNFSSWDSDEDGIFAKWDSTPGKDIIDHYPDVAVGRLACRNSFEVKIMVDKIKKYETSTYGQNWYDKMIAAGGDSHDDSGTNYLEGELACDKVLDEFMSEYTPVRLYASYKDSNPSYVPTTTNIKREFNKGAGHFYFDGHANPASWITHYPGEFDSWIPNGGIKIYHFPSLFNLNKLPVVCVQGCHNSQINVSIKFALNDKDNSQHSWTYGQLVPECWSWWLTRKIFGGSIATIGNTGLGYGTVGEHGDLDGDGNNEPDCLEALGGYWFIQFYKSIDEGYDILGETWVMAQNNYMDTFPPMDYQTDAKTCQELLLLGDPSLQMGGVP